MVIPREDKCSSRRLKEKPKEEKAAVKVVRRAVRKNGEEMRGRIGGRSEVRWPSATLLNGPIRGRESIPVEKMAAPQMQKGRRNPYLGVQKGTEDRTQSEAESKRGVGEGVDSCRACGVACQEDCQDGGPEDSHAEALHEPTEVGVGQEWGQLGDKHDCAKEPCRHGCH